MRTSITDDVKLFVDQTLAIGVGLLSSGRDADSFVVILWGLSAEAPLHLLGREFDIPGYLVWGALIYAILGTVLTLDRLAAGQPGLSSTAV